MIFDFFQNIKALFTKPVKEEKLTKPFVQLDEPESKAIDMAGSLMYGFNFDEEIKNINELVKRYRQFSLMGEVEEAIDEIINEAVIYADDKSVVSLNLDAIEKEEALKKKINDEFEYIKQKMKVEKKLDEDFRRWYIDGRLYVQPLFKEADENGKYGIADFKVISPLNIIRVYDKKESAHFYIIKSNDKEGLKVPEDRIIFVPSGISDPENKFYISHLHKAIKPANQLGLLEDSAVIYRFTRAPERRAFYVDTGKLTKQKAEEFVQSLMNKFKTKVIYDQQTGEVSQKKNIMTMLEDFWLPRQEGSRGTEIQTLSGSQNLGEMGDILYFKKKLYKALRVPSSRADDENSPMVDFGRSGEISRDELRFHKFINKLRAKYSWLFMEALKIQLVAKKIISLEDWKNTFADKVKIVWAEDSHFAEIAEADLLQRRLDLVNNIEPHVGKYFSRNFVHKSIMKRTDDEIKRITEEIEKDPKPPVDEFEGE